MGRIADGKRKRGRGTTDFASKNISKKQKKHLEEFGEIHPADDRKQDRTKYQKVEDEQEKKKLPKNKRQVQVEESDSSSDEESAYNQLLKSVHSGEQSSDSEIDNDESSGEDSEESEDDIEDAAEEDDDEEEGAEKDEDVEEKEDAEEDTDDEDEEQIDEEDDESESDEDEVAEEKQDNDESDPFCQHIEVDIPEAFVENLADKTKWTKSEKMIPHIGKCIVTQPADFSPVAAPVINDLSAAHVKESLMKNLKVTNSTCLENSSSEGPLTALQQPLFNIFNSYQDLLYTKADYTQWEEIRTTYCLHILNHVLKTRSKVITHNSKIKSKKDDIPDEYRDQGLTRPKVLVVLPFRNAAYQVVNTLCSLLADDKQSFVNNRKRFDKEFTTLEEESKRANRPDDFEAMFEGNIDDHFRVGIGIAKKSVKLYTEFYKADIILASPLGLRTIIGSEGEEKRDYDFLSSIEVLIFDQADTFLMQNWDHITHLMEHLHLQPKDAHGVDFSRVRMWTLNGWSKFYRQTLVFSSIVFPELNGLFNKHCHNYAGKISLKHHHNGGSICQIVTQLPQVFQKLRCDSYYQLADARFQFFIKKVLPQFTDSVMSHTMVFIPSYFDFVRIRNHFKRETINCGVISEYSSDKSVSRSRTQFFQGKIHFLLYTERFHFFRRYRIRGIKHLICYELPRYPHFYSEISNFLKDPRKRQNDSDLSCTVIYSKYDMHRLAGIVGTERASHMIKSDKNVHMFVTGENT
ncbi:unnamed protein product [Owenia fusiformis]|uniref:U3 small nucleolar RNA-associated protein 25 homolog n=1 Tax=Owenia fusiformis TaxID=6347 RepID=A0A8S4PHV3_OWEFU|nr:unnamed protein product [Owenia fusiformis]